MRIISNDTISLERSYKQSAYGALINKKCVCQGYAEAYKRILNEAGIECIVVCGKIKGDLEYHAWNIVVIAGKCYHVDTTWDSYGFGMKSDEFFCKDDEFFIPTRLWQRNTKYICNAKGNMALQAKQEIRLNERRFALAGIDRRYFS